MVEKVGVFIFDSYFDVMINIEEKYKRWDLFEAVYRYVRFDQTKRLPSELAKIFKVLKPILDVQKKKLLRNEKRRKTKKEEDASFGEIERLAEGDCKDAGEDFGGGYEKTGGDISSKIEVKKSANGKKLADKKVRKKSSLGGSCEDERGIDGGCLGDEIKFDAGGECTPEAIENKGLEACETSDKILPNGEPNVCDNKIKNKTKTSAKHKSSSTKLKKEKLLGGDAEGVVIEEKFEGKKEKIKEEKDRKTTIPTLKEVEEFCQKACKNLDGASFYHYYESKNWKASNKVIKDWRACALAWDKKEARTLKRLEGESNNGKAEVEYSTLGGEIGGV